MRHSRRLAASKHNSQDFRRDTLERWWSVLPTGYDVRDGQVASRPVYAAIGVRLAG